jgi:stage V sporulation protein AC
MNMDKKTYVKYAKAHAPKSPLLSDCIHAFLVGGSICALGEGISTLYGMSEALTKEDVGTLTAATLVFLSVLLTALGVYDNIAKFAGAGTLVPITGFANAVASPAIDSRAEGFVLGVGAKIFTVAGPVLLYGTVAGAVYGVFYYFIQLL